MELKFQRMAETEVRELLEKCAQDVTVDTEGPLQATAVRPGSDPSFVPLLKC